MKNLFAKASKKMPDLFDEKDPDDTSDMPDDSGDDDATACAEELISAIHSEDADGVVKAFKDLIDKI